MIQKDISRCLLFATCLVLFETSIAEVYYNGLERYGFKVCKDDKSRQISYNTKVSTIGYVSYTTSCGLFGWARCRRSRKVTKYKLQRAYRTTWDAYLRCCRGWTKQSYSSRDCQKPVCDSGCNNGGRCESPNTCNCKSGWTGYTCSQDINECYPNNGGCEHGCINRKGVTEPLCTCRRGYIKHPYNQKKCTDVDECKDTSICRCSMKVPNNPCKAKCTNSPGRFHCSCGNGYYLQYKTVCTDYNECSFNNGGCSHSCRNVPGSYHCGCPRGFRLDSNLKLCVDVNECEDNNGNCQHICQNLYGRHRCSCRQGFVLDGNKRTCSDINECVLDEDDCDQSCENIWGAYRCYCRNGYNLSSDGRTCKDVDECVAMLSGCHQKCVNYEGSFRCSCGNGYKLMYDGKSCKGLPCGQILPSRNGKMWCSGLVTNDICTFSCNSGYDLVGSKNRTCLPNSGWSGTPTMCQAVPCEKILPPNNGKMSCSGLVTNDICTFSCDSGYDLVGSKNRTCLPNSRWSGTFTTCKAKHCPELTTLSYRHTLSLPCFTSFGSTCHFGCRRGLFMQGDGRAKCNLNRQGDGVSWTIGQFSCREIRSKCHPNPCRHGGKCLVKMESPTCDCLGTGYKGSVCQTGVISSPIFPKLQAKKRSGTLYLKARPSRFLEVSFHSSGDLIFDPPLLEFYSYEVEAEFEVKAKEPGIHEVSYSLGGEDKEDFQTPQSGVLLVTPDDSDRHPRARLPIGCKERVTEWNLECELRLSSTAPWTGTPPSTGGIVHLLKSSTLRVPISLVGLSIKDLNVPRDKLVKIAVATTSFQKEFKIWHETNGTCHSSVSNTDNLLALMWGDVFPSSFMKALTEIAPEWLQFAVDENSDAFDIQNIAVNFAPDLEHCSGFPFTDSSIQVFYRPTINYNVRVVQQEITLLADGTTCFAIDICQSAMIVNLPERQANVIKNSMNLFRNMKAMGLNMKVDSIGLFEKVKTSPSVKRIIWNGIKLAELSSFHYNMWLKGKLEWKMRTQSRLLFVTLRMTGEAFIKYQGINKLFVDALNQPLEVQLNGTGFLHVKGRVLGKNFNMILPPVAMTGKAFLGGQHVCGRSLQGVFLTSEESVRNLLNRSPLSGYIRPKETEPLRLAILVSLRRRTRHKGVQFESSLQGISLHLSSKLCMAKLCFNDLILEIEVQGEYSCHAKLSPVSTFRAKGKVLKTIPSSTDGNVLTILKHSVVKTVFPLETNLVSVNFVAKVDLLGISQALNVTLQKEKLWFEMQGEIFQKHLANVKVIADTNDVEDWSALQFFVYGNLTNTSQLSKLLQTKITNFVKYLAEKASRMVQNVENSLLQANQRISKANASVYETHSLLRDAENEMQRKSKKLRDISKTYRREKVSFNSSLLQHLQLENKQICEYKNCRYIDTNTCIPTVCQKPVVVNNTFTKCDQKMERYYVKEVKTIKVEEIERIQTSVVKHHSDCGKGESISDAGTVIASTGGAISSLGLPGIGGVMTVVGLGTKIFGELYTGLFGCDSYSEKVPGPVVNKKHEVLKHVMTEKEVQRVVYDCKTKTESLISSYSRSYECCSEEIRGKIQVLDSECVTYNLRCEQNMRDLRNELSDEQGILERYFNDMTKKAKKVVVAQLEMSKAKADVTVANNKLKIARAALKQYEYAKDSIDIKTVRSRERLGLKFAQKLKRSNGKPLVTVDAIKFSFPMAQRSRTTRFPITLFLRTLERTDKLEFSFPMDFKNEDRSLTIASRLIIKDLFETPPSRRRRSIRKDPISSIVGRLHGTILSLGQRECLFSEDAHVYFSDVIDSVRLFINSRKELEMGMVASLRDLSKFSLHGDSHDYGPLEEIQSTFNDTLQSIKKVYLNELSTTSWNSSLEDLRAFLDVWSKGKNISECSGIQDCVEFFFDTLAEMYKMENHPRAIEIKEGLKDLKKLINEILNGRPSMAALDGIIAQAITLIVKSKDDIILCSKKPSIERNSPVKVVTTEGETIHLLCEAASPIELLYTWYKNDELLEDTNSTKLVLANISRENEGVYHCEVSNNRGTTMSNITIVEVHQKPQIIEQPQGTQVIVGEDLVLLRCNSTGIPRPLTEWFFIPIKGGHVVRLNSTNPVLAMHNLTSESNGIYYCNVSNRHGTIQSINAKLDVLDFAPGVPRIAVLFGLKYCKESSKPRQEPTFSAKNSFWKKLCDVLGWPSDKIESRYFHPLPIASISFVLNGDDLQVPGHYPPVKRRRAAVNNFSMSRVRMGKSLRTLYFALTEGSFQLEMNKTICVGEDTFSIGFLPQRCPKGKRPHKNGFLCVNCAPGNYEAGNRTCLQCPSGTYQPEEGRTECIKCPYRRSFTEPGAFTLSQCLDMSVLCRPPWPTMKTLKSPGKMEQIYRTGDIIRLECKIGYKGIGNSTRQCDKGKWTAATDFYCQKTCLPPWTEFRKHCYKLTALRSNSWRGASAKCQSLQSHMLTINSEKENTFAAQLVQKYLRRNNLTQAHMWLGLFKSHPKGEFQWVDGSPFGNYTNWSSGEPNNIRGKELCSEMLVFGSTWTLKKWNDIRCDTTQYKPITVCEKFETHKLE